MATNTICRILPRYGGTALQLVHISSEGLSPSLAACRYYSSTSHSHPFDSHLVKNTYNPTKTQVCLSSSSSHNRIPGSTSQYYTHANADPQAPEDAEFNTKVQENLENIRSQKFEEEITHPEELKHFRARNKKPYVLDHDINTPLSPPTSEPPIGVNALPHPIWSDAEVHSVRETHKEPERIVDRLAFGAVRTLRGTYDFVSGYNRKVRDETLWINRICFLETVAGVPGMVAAMVRHLDSLRRMRRDHGWIHTLLEEAENERMHLMTALQLKQPSIMFRASVMVAQGVFVSMFSVAYMLSPRFCHRMVGYLEEEAVKTYSKLLKDMEHGTMQHWNTTPAPDLALRYWALKPDAVMKDVILAIRADEAHHRVVNHTLGSMKRTDYNPYRPGQ